MLYTRARCILPEGGRLVFVFDIIVFNYSTLKEEEIVPTLLFEENLKLVVTSGASCPDITVDLVIQKIVDWRGESESIEAVLEGRI